jgi:SAM-dependent methyltransferase
MSRDEMRALAGESLARGDALGWFETLYRRAGADLARVPWADLVPNPLLVEWLAGDGPGFPSFGDTPASGPSPSPKVLDAGPSPTALVVGCGYGDDAELLAEAGYRVTAFDVAPTAIEACRARSPGSPVDYVVADALAPPAAWRGAFHLVLESYTFQVLPPEARGPLLARLAEAVAPGGRLLILCRGRDPGDPTGELPWPLTRAEIDGVLAHGLDALRFEDLLDGETPPVRRFRALYRRAAPLP